MCHICFIHLSTGEQSLVTMKSQLSTSAAVNVGGQMFLLQMHFISLGYLPNSDIVGSHGSLIFSFLRNLCIHFHNGCTSSLSHSQCVSALLSAHAYQIHLLSLIAAITTGMR